MSVQRVSIESLLRSSEYWYLNKDKLNFDVEFKGTYYVVSPNELADLHPHLPLAIGHNLRIDAKKSNNPRLGGLTVDAIRAFYFDGYIDITSLSGKLVRKVNPDNIGQDDKNTKRVYVYGDDVRMYDAVVNSSKISLPYIKGWVGTPVKKLDLESTYPGWEERWRLSESLGVTGVELMRFVFNLTPSAAISNVAPLNNVNFD